MVQGTIFTAKKLSESRKLFSALGIVSNLLATWFEIVQRKKSSGLE
jgi:hypothetical protein